MADSFGPIWGKIQYKITPGTIIKNWTQLKGYLGDVMEVTSVSDNVISLVAPNAKNEIHVPRAQFEKVWDLWPAYKAGGVRRSEFIDITFFSKYIISIFHHLEVEPHN